MLRFLAEVRKYPTVYPLIIANVIPALEVFFLDWNVIHLLIHYWLETAVIGFYMILRLKMSDLGPQVAPKKNAMIIFLIFHCSGFLSVHFLFLLVFYGIASGQEFPMGIAPIFEEVFTSIFVTALLFMVSHGISFFYYVVEKQEHKKVANERETKVLGSMIGNFYGRIIKMHLALLFLCFPVVILSKFFPITASLIVILTKIFFDVHAHIKEHQKNAEATQ